MLNPEKEKLWSGTFLNKCLTSCSVNCDEVVSAIWNIMLKEHWQVIVSIGLFPVEYGGLLSFETKPNFHVF